jgi:SsrA-binding protein
MAETNSGIKIIAKNKKAHFNYTVEESYECGVVLVGTEVKSVKEGQISFPDAFAEIRSGEVWMKNVHIADNPFASLWGHDPDRPKKLLLHKNEIKRLTRKVDEKGMTLVPLEFYLKKGRLKVQLGVCKGKKQFDKRDTVRGRDLDREMQRELKTRNR